MNKIKKPFERYIVLTLVPPKKNNIICAKGCRIYSDTIGVSSYNSQRHYCPRHTEIMGKWSWVTVE